MIDEKFLRYLAAKSTTGFTNVAREYLQHLFLSVFYSLKDSRHFLFKGGTALRIALGSPRFSQDLDFSGVRNSVKYESLLETTLLELSKQQLDVDLVESKPTSGGHISIITANIPGAEKIEIQNQISFRPKQLKSELVMIDSNLIPAYPITLLDRKLLVSEKLDALLDRGKSRDFFDLYFILRNNELRQLINLTSDKRKAVLDLIKHRPAKTLSRELRPFLPKDFRGIIAELPAAISRELSRFT